MKKLFTILSFVLLLAIYHGTNGSAPKVGIQKAVDGQYYWTTDGEWLTDDAGEKIPAAVPSEDGKYSVFH